MKFAKFFQYAYLVFAVLFLINAVNEYVNVKKIDYPSILFAALAVFMFFFRRRFNNRQDSANK